MAAPIAGVRIDTYGMNATVKAIQAFDPVMYRRMLAAAKKAVGPIQAEAKADSPIRSGQMAANWRIKKSRSTRRNGYSFGYSVVGGLRQNVILEFAGSRTGGATAQGKSLIQGLTSTYGAPGRFAWAAYDRNHAQVDADFMSAVKTAEAEMQTRLEAM